MLRATAVTQWLASDSQGHRETSTCVRKSQSLAKGDLSLPAMPELPGADCLQPGAMMSSISCFFPPTPLQVRACQTSETSSSFKKIGKLRFRNTYLQT